MRQSSDRSSRSGMLLGVLMLAGSGYSLVQSLVVPALPTLQLRLDTTQTGATWVFTAFLLSSAVATPARGPLGDMFGRRGSCSARSPHSRSASSSRRSPRSLAVMIVARTVQGLGGAIFPLAFGIIRDEFDGGDVARGTAWMSAVLGGGGVLGIVLAGPILQHLSYHWLFWVPLVVVVASGIAAYLVVPDRPGRATAASPGRPRCCSPDGSSACWSRSARARLGLVVVAGRRAVRVVHAAARRVDQRGGARERAAGRPADAARSGACGRRTPPPCSWAGARTAHSCSSPSTSRHRSARAASGPRSRRRGSTWCRGPAPSRWRAR